MFTQTGSKDQGRGPGVGACVRGWLGGATINCLKSRTPHLRDDETVIAKKALVLKLAFTAESTEHLPSNYVETS